MHATATVAGVISHESALVMEECSEPSAVQAGNSARGSADDVTLVLEPAEERPDVKGYSNRSSG